MAKAGKITPDIVEQTPDTAKAPTPGELASSIWYDSPEEAINYALKGLNHNNSHPDSARLHAVLGFAYQRLGDYKTAWVHLKKGKHLLSNASLAAPVLVRKLRPLKLPNTMIIPSI